MSKASDKVDPYKHLVWRCRRGLKELDVMLERFLRLRFADLSEQEKANFEALLAESDMDLLEWFLGKSKPEKLSYRTLVALIASLPA